MKKFILGLNNLKMLELSHTACNAKRKHTYSWLAWLGLNLIACVIILMLPKLTLATTLSISKPIHARNMGLESLRLAVQKDGGVTLPDDLDKYVKNRQAALQLGKALFWDMQVGSDGIQACASCHFHAGADNRSKNQLNPNISAIVDDHQGDILGYISSASAGNPVFDTHLPNQKLRRKDFPFIKSIQDLIRTPEGAVLPALGNSDDIASSMGVFFTFFDGVNPGEAFDSGTPLFDPIFNIDQKTSVRRVEPRNTPSVINAIFNFTNFWDGRAHPHFNGQNGFGDQDQTPNTFIVVNTDENGLISEQISIANASLASQAISPLPSPVEMSFGDFSQGNGRNLPDIGMKLLRPSTQTQQPLTPLGQQKVHRYDSLLGNLSQAPYPGLTTTYESLIKQAFAEQYWESEETVDFPTISYTQMEFNFGLFFGLSVALYESTLVSDQTPFDRWMETGQFNYGFRTKELKGLNLFANEGKCITCHAGPELTNASIRSTKAGTNIIRAMAMMEGEALYDNGFYNVSVTPTTDDIGRGGLDPFGQPIAFTRQALFDRLNIVTPSFPILGNEFIPAKDESLKTAVCDDVDGSGFCEKSEAILPPFQRVAVDGAFKTPGLRNSLLTGPYFHNGGMATLMQVVQFYNRGGNFCDFNLKDLDPDITPLGLTDEQEKQLVAFLVSLTDLRVVFQQAPFDHPELRIPSNGLDTVGTRKIKSVGAYGTWRPLWTFLNLNPYDAIYTPPGICSIN